MCLICADLIAKKLTALEARGNLGEMHNNIPKAHRIEVLRLIWAKEDEEYVHWYEDAEHEASD